MIVDEILNRKDADDANAPYNYDPREFYHYVNYWAAHRMPDAVRIAHAMDELEEEDVKDALCLYIIHQDYNLAIIDYIMSKDWLRPERRS